MTGSVAVEANQLQPVVDRPDASITRFARMLNRRKRLLADLVMDRQAAGLDACRAGVMKPDPERSIPCCEQRIDGVGRKWRVVGLEPAEPQSIEVDEAAF